MKKSILLFAFAVPFVFTSCKKTYECDCTTDLVATASGQTVSTSFSMAKNIEASSEKKAQKECDSHKQDMENTYGEDYSYTSQGYTVTSNTTCTMTKQ